MSPVSKLGADTGLSAELWASNFAWQLVKSVAS